MKGCVSMAKTKSIVRINAQRCKACRLCISFCPQKVLSLDERINQSGFHPVKILNQEECSGCRSCQLICPDLAIFVVKKK